MSPHRPGAAPGAGPVPEVKGFLETSLTDWKGRIAAVVFLPRCTFRCPYCHNHRLVTRPEELATWPLDEVLGRLERLRAWVDGVCVTGGEPTLHPGLGAMLRRIRDRGWAVKLDTNGSRPGALGELLAAGLVDAVSLDVKAPLEPVPYRRNAGPGSDPGAVAESLGLLRDAPVELEVRTTVHPQLLSLEELVRLGAALGRRLRSRGSAARWTLQRCRVDETLDPGLRQHPPLSPGEFEAWRRRASRAFAAALDAGG